MENLGKLEQKLEDAKRELASIRKRVVRDTPFEPRQLDGHSESYSWDEYQDPERAKKLQTEIEYLSDKVSNYARDAESVRFVQNRKNGEDIQWRKDKISSTSKAIYDEKMDDYMKKNLWGKATTILAGKKPKKMNSQEIVSSFGTEAVSKITDPAIVELTVQRENQLKKVQESYANDPKQLEYAIAATNQYFDTEISKVSSTFSKSLEEIVNDGKKR